MSADFVDKRAADAIESQGQKILSQEEIDALVNNLTSGKPVEEVEQPSSSPTPTDIPVKKTEPASSKDTPKDTASDELFSDGEIDAILSALRNKRKSRLEEKK